MYDKKNFLKGISAKLSVLIGGALTVSGASAVTVPNTQHQPSTDGPTVKSFAARTQLPAKLTLKQQKSGFSRSPNMNPIHHIHRIRPTRRTPPARSSLC